MKQCLIESTKVVLLVQIKCILKECLIILANDYNFSATSTHRSIVETRNNQENIILLHKICNPPSQHFQRIQQGHDQQEAGSLYTTPANSSQKTLQQDIQSIHKQRSRVQRQFLKIKKKPASGIEENRSSQKTYKIFNPCKNRDQGCREKF